MTNDDLLSSAEAAALLGVSAATLYAYVSRGLLRAARGVDGRRSLYGRAEVLALRDRQRRPRGAAEAARGTLDFGQPVLASALTLIADGQLLFRGIPATQLADDATLEDVAALLWQRPVGPPPRLDLPRLDRTLPYMDRAMMALAHAAMHDPRAYDLSADGLAQTGPRILAALVAATGAQPGGAPVHVLLARHWKLDAAGADLVRGALVLCADHELNASTFAVRVVTSTGATAYAALQAGLAALSGPRHGGMTLRVAALAEVIGKGDARAVLAERQRRGDEVPGFGHRLYPDGDPRGAWLLAHLPRRRAAFAQRLAAAGEAVTGRKATVDVGLVGVAQALDLPPGAALQIFAIGRAVGWLAHAGEQAVTGALIRPRADYVGPKPPSVVAVRAG